MNMISKNIIKIVADWIDECEWDGKDAWMMYDALELLRNEGCLGLINLDTLPIHGFNVGTDYCRIEKLNKDGWCIRASDRKGYCIYGIEGEYINHISDLENNNGNTNNKPHKKRGPPSDETRKKLSDAQKGKVKSQDTKDKISKANLGRRLSKETKKKMSESAKKRPSRKKIMV